MYNSTSSRNRGYSCTCTYIHSSSSTRCTAVHMNIYQVPARRYGSSKGYFLRKLLVHVSNVLCKIVRIVIVAYPCCLLTLCSFAHMIYVSIRLPSL